MRKSLYSVWKYRYLLFALAAFWGVQAISQESNPNLSGIWRWNPDKSHVGGPPTTDRRVKIEQQGSDLTITTRVEGMAGEEIRKFHYTIGSDNNTNETMGSSVKSKVEWKGGSLIIDSVATTRMGELHMSDTWTLSTDGQTLTLQETRSMGARPPDSETTVFAKQPVADWEPPQPAKPAEQVFKNVQVFKGMPAPELMNVMRSFTHSLGVRCDFCHVEGAFDKDDKEEKQTARKMILMARQINTDNFGGHMRVTCFTCHRGATEPAAAPK